jgi:ATP-dependent DNA helicase RecG
VTNPEEILQALANPIEAAAESDSILSAWRGAEAHVSERLKELESHGLTGRAGPKALALAEAFRGFDALTTEDKRLRLAEARRRLDDLRETLLVEPPREPPAKPLSDIPIQYVKGVGPKRASLLAKKGIETVEDALFLLPYAYEDRRIMKDIADLEVGALETFSGEVFAAGPSRTRRGRIWQIIVGDTMDRVACKWFRFKEAYMAGRFKPGTRVVVSGRVGSYGMQKELHHPDIELMEEGEDSSHWFYGGRLVPKYSATEGLSPKLLRSIVAGVAESYADQVEEIFPGWLRREHGLPVLSEALKTLHAPGDDEDPEALNRGNHPAHSRIVFEELFLLELGMARRRAATEREARQVVYTGESPLRRKLLESLPFSLTAAQKKVLGEIDTNLAGPHPMNRLLQGDVGCGKTVVALAAACPALERGRQVAFMVPTEILAEQHYRTLRRLMEPLGVEMGLLTSAVKGHERRGLLEGASEGSLQLLVGTHAIIQEGVELADLGLAVIDEQHRFGVLQRANLRQKGYSPDVLVMTATPIPRTLALTVYGDLDLSVIDELPAGRGPLETRMMAEGRRGEAHELIIREVASGRQAYVVYPLVEESEKLDLKAATAMFEELKAGPLSGLAVDLLHGRMKSEEKEAVMRRFVSGETSVLVCTTVIEVGVDQPNASVMLIEHAERFGLAQLHQLRGRVGRGPYPSYCMLVAHWPLSEDARARLAVMTQTTDGFLIAEKDLEIRGPGELVGTRQSGLPELRYANLVRDQQVLERARKAAFELLNSDPSLERPEHQAIRRAFKRQWAGKLELLEVG